MELKRAEGTTIYISCNKSNTVSREKLNRIGFCVVMVFLSCFIFMFPIGSFSSVVDVIFHMITVFIPILCLICGGMKYGEYGVISEVSENKPCLQKYL